MAVRIAESEIWEALEGVIDPELGLDFPNLGLVYGVDVEEEELLVKVTFTLTTPACPIGPEVSAQMRELILAEVPGVRKVETELVFEPTWSPELMSDDAKFALGFVY